MKTNALDKSCVTININCGSDNVSEIRDLLFFDIQREVLAFKTTLVKEFRVFGGRLDVLDITGVTPRPEHAGRLICSAPIDGGGVRFARCVNDWFKDNSGGCGKVFHENGNWCFTEGC